MQAPASLSDYRIGAEDLLEITLFNVDGADGRVTPRTVRMRVSQRGVITLPLLGEISAIGLTVSALEQALRERYDKYIHNPQIGVLVTEFRQRVSVIGEVQRPSVVKLTGPKTVLELLAQVGGVTERAGSQVHIYRQVPEGRQSFVIDLSALASNIGLINDKGAPFVNMPVQAGDVINVPQAGMFFLDGAIKTPGPFRLRRTSTLTQALATAGGVNTELANDNDISIFRRKDSGEVETLHFDLSEILAGNITDPQIKADDVIIVPVSTGKWFVNRFVGTIISGFSVGALIPR
jgi:polysaccharide export outer membrane protein